MFARIFSLKMTSRSSRRAGFRLAAVKFAGETSADGQ